MKRLVIPAAIVAVGLAGFQLAQANEGLKLQPYKDMTGRWTVCRGHTGDDVHPGVKWTKPACEVVFDKDVAFTVEGLNACLHRSLNSNQSAAIVDFAFNIGVPKTCSSALVSKINAGDLGGAVQEFPKWGHARVKGKLVPVQALLKRRQDEAKLFSQPVTGASQSVNIDALKELIKNAG